MKILWFTNTPCSASAELNAGINRGGWLSSLEKHLSKRDGIELYVAFYFYRKIKPFHYNDTWFYPIFRKNRGTKIERYFSRLFNKDFNDKEEVPFLQEVVNNIQPDIIHVHGTEDNFGLIQYYTHVPVIISIQGILSSVIEKFYSGIPDSINRKYESIKSKLLIKTANFTFNSFNKKAIRERNILKNSRYIIGRTDWDKRVTRVLAPNSLYFEGQEMLRESFYNYNWNKIKFNKVLKIVTTISGGIYKGFETIVKTSKILSLVSFKFEWFVIGLNDSSKSVNLVEKWLEEVPENNNIKFLGERTEKEIVSNFLSADIYCQVSHIENSPNSLCEAMLVGMPIVASFAGGTNSILKDGEEGILVQDGDPYSFAGAIVEMAADFPMAKKFALNARNHALNRHDKSKIIDDLIKVYYDIVKFS